VPLPLRAARERRDISVRDLADTVGVTPATLRKYETGVISPVPDDVLIAIALTLGDRALLEQHPVTRALRSWPKAA
jgi:transcriptional regulator with XRE-family HTH domain